ncbi:MAG TPA: DegV family protein [Anaerolineales bacterium]|nr:DegV family protein [Anaerolineales bacterium]
MSIAIVTDSTCDLPPHVIQELKITVVPLYINIGDKGYLDGVDITRKDFYTNLPGYSVHPTTGTPGVDAFKNAYQTLAEKGCTEILSIHISKKLSATVNIARNASQEFKQIPVTVRDAGQLSLGTGFQVERAARMALEGKSMQEIETALDDLKARTFVAARLDTLEFLRRSGRMNRFIAGIGSVLQLKPILTMQNGQPGSERVRTTHKAEARLLKMLEELQPIEQFSLLHTNAAEQAMAFRQYAAHLLPEQATYSMDITPVIGAHLGPGAVGYAVISKNPVKK